MKKLIIAITSAFTAMALLPLIGIGKTSSTEAIAASAESSLIEESSQVESSIAEDSSLPESSVEDTSAEEDISAAETAGFPQEAFFRILDTSSGEVAEVPDREFCCGTLAYEMLPGYETEALKAQCVACYTHFCRLREQQRIQPDKELKGADFSADLSKNELYFSDENMKKVWGKMYSDSRAHIEQAVDEAAGLVLTDKDGLLIDAAYHAISGGVTEAAADIFGKDDPHLQPAASPWDKTAPGYCSESSFSEKEFAKLLKGENSKLNSKTLLSQTDYDIKRTASGAVLEIKLGGCKFSGADIRNVFSLRSADFDLRHEEKKFIFTVRGYGHGVGMSQNGAQCMAQQGESFREILMHYYKDTYVTVLSEST